MSKSIRTGCDRKTCVDRRGFLAAATAGSITVALGDLFAGRVSAEDADRKATLTGYPHKKIAQLDQLAVDTPVEFEYPQEGATTGCMLVKLGRPAGGGIGPDQDVVAFSTVCSHMGGDLSGGYKAQNKVIGPCMEHLTTFDLTRHGIVVAGHATQPLPQVVLELNGNDISAVGMLGLIYGFSANPERERSQ